MTNEELVALIQAGERDKINELWQNVERFVWQQAGRRILRGADGVTVEDLYQSGYLALVEAVESYDAERGMSFIGWLAVALKNTFNAAAGQRSERQRRDPIHQAVSVDAPAYQDEAGPTVAEIVPDESAVIAFSAVEYRDFLRYCRRLIAAALYTLPPAQGNLLRLHYLEGRSLDDTAALCGLSCKQAASDTKFRALFRLEWGKYRRELRECLDGLEEYEAARLECYDRNTCRWTEAAALLHIEGGTL